MQPRQRLSHAFVHGGAFIGRAARQACIGEDPAIHPFHQIEWRADDLPILAKQELLGDGISGVMQRLLHTIFTVDLMGGWQKLARRLLPQDVLAVIESDDIGRVGLTIGKL